MTDRRSRSPQSRHQFSGSKGKGHSTKNIAFASPGQVFTFEKSENGVYGNTGHYVGRWACQDDVVKWQAESNAVDRAAEMRERARKEIRDRLDHEALELCVRLTLGGTTIVSSRCALPDVIQSHDELSRGMVE